MNPIYDSMPSKISLIFLHLVSRDHIFQENMRQTPEAKQFIRNRGMLAHHILEMTDNAKTVENLLQSEMFLQNLDELSAQTQQDKTSIENAQREYRQLAATVAQMRRNPYEYVQANISFHETKGDCRKLPRGRIRQLHANIARLRNRMAFAPEEERNIWEARMRLAAKTGEMIRAMHRTLAQEYEEKSNL